ncbi:phage portal protein, partial [Salmonella enterica]|nr:phage portal protein [Salmonella sp. 15E126]
QNTAGLGDVEKAERIYKKSEVAPVQRRFMMAVNNDPEIPENLHLNFDLSYTESTNKGAV